MLGGVQRYCSPALLTVVLFVPARMTGAQPAPEAAPPLALPNAEAFATRQTDHFLIWYDTSYDVVRPLVNRLEGTFDAVVRVGRYYGFAMDDRPEPLRVILVDRHDDFSLLAREVGIDAGAAAGFYDPASNLAVFGNIVNSPALSALSRQIEQLEQRLQRGRQQTRHGPSAQTRANALGRDLSRLLLQRDAIVERFNRLVLQHEAAHQILFNVGVHGRETDNPTWLVEGLAMQFEVPQSSAQRGLHRINQMRLADLRDSAGIVLGAQTVSDADYASAFGENGLVPLTELIEDDGVFAGPGDRVTTVYAQAWALVFYLGRTQKDALSRYLAQVAARAPRTSVEPQQELQCFSMFFGPVDEAFQRGWLDYVAHLRFDPAAD